MKITLRVHGSLARIAGTTRQTLELPDGISVAALLTILNQRYPGFEAKLSGQGAAMHIPYNTFVNRKAVPESQMSGRKLRDGDCVHIILPVAGG